MTPQEAVAFLKETAFLNETKVGCVFTKDKQLIEVCDVAISALEKQIPKKPQDIGCFSDIFVCPCCEDTALRTSKYCEKCGQALDWSDCNG